MPRFGGKSLKGRHPLITVAASNSNFKDAADYVCDYSNDEDTINAAIDASISGSTVFGGVVVYPGNYSLNNPITVDAYPFSLISWSPWWNDNTRLIQNNVAQPIIRILGTEATAVDRIKIQGLGIFGSGAAGAITQNGIEIQYARDIDIDNCYIRAMGGNGIRFTGPNIWNFQIRNTIIQGGFQHGILASNTNVTALKIYGGEIRTNQLNGIFADSTCTGFNWRMEGTLYQSNVGFGIALNGLTTPAIIGNYFESNRGNGGLEADIIIGNIAGRQCNNFRIADNFMSSSAPAEVGILVLGADGGNIFNNDITGHGTAGGRNIDIGTTGGGYTCRNISCEFTEAAGDIAIGGNPSRNQGGTAIFSNLRSQNVGTSGAHPFAFQTTHNSSIYSVSTPTGLFPTQIPTFVNSDTTPTVNGGNVFRANNTIATSITAFDNGSAGQIILIIFANANTTIRHGVGNIRLVGGADFTGTQYDTLKLVYDGTDYLEVSRSVV